MEFEKQVNSYFKANNSLARRIVLEQECIQKMYSDNWEQMTCEERESLYNSFAVPASVLEKYSDVPKTSEYPDSFPRHIVACGEKIVVDYNDCQTWPDEHSGPFSWKTKSQQDLTLLDLEPDQLTKKSERTRKAPPPAKQVFETKTCPWKRENGGIWDSPFLAAERGMDPVFTNNITEPNSNTNSEEEEKNTAIQEDQPLTDTKVIPPSKQPPPLPSTRPPSITRPPSVRPPPPPVPTTVPRKVDYHTVPLADSHPKKAGRKSHRNSRAEIKASTQKNSLNQEAKQNVDHKRDSGKFESQVAAGTHLSINNPAFTSNDEKGVDDPKAATTSLGSKGEWSHFIGEKEASSASSTPTKQLLKEPEPMSISRQVEPIPMKNTSYVVDEEESVAYSCNNEESESLLKTNDQFEKANLNAVNTMESEENDESKRDSNILRSGFDFLDDW
ncbi:uncharacterized protein C1orf198 homolog [Octopus sinensis]|uniref:Uncharacterized protein C1orf198 homolog n=1 Tax=Octopus sinensis TaxID=2607531 RepID=A0A6P7SY98_9MOLL|nr:uncharacterized protein C1orf198 homolog [Octopus sinensis]